MLIQINEYDHLDSGSDPDAEIFPWEGGRGWEGIGGGWGGGAILIGSQRAQVKCISSCSPNVQNIFLNLTSGPEIQIPPSNIPFPEP